MARNVTLEALYHVWHPACALPLHLRALVAAYATHAHSRSGRGWRSQASMAHCLGVADRTLRRWLVELDAATDSPVRIERAHRGPTTDVYRVLISNWQDSRYVTPQRSVTAASDLWSDTDEQMPGHGDPEGRTQLDPDARTQGSSRSATAVSYRSTPLQRKRRNLRQESAPPRGRLGSHGRPARTETAPRGGGAQLTDADLEMWSRMAREGRAHWPSDVREQVEAWEARKWGQSPSDGIDVWAV